MQNKSASDTNVTHKLPPADTAFQAIMSDLEKHYKVSDRLYDILSDSLGKHLAKTLATQKRELMKWVRDEVEGMKYQQPLLGTPVHTEEIILAVNNALDDVKAKLAQRRSSGERENAK